LSIQQLTTKIENQHNKDKSLVNQFKIRPSPTNQQKVNDFKESKENELFEAGKCHCPDPDNCTCPRSRKIPQEERPFIVDQRTNRQGGIGGVDREATSKLRKKAAKSEPNVSV